MISSMERAIELPWSLSPEENHRFRKILIVVAVITVILSILVPYLPVEKPDRKKAEEIPPRFAKLILEKKTPPPPPPPKVEKKKPKKKVEKKKVTPKKKVVKKKKVIKPDPDRARKVAEKSGLLAFQDDLADLRTSVSDQVLKNRNLQKGGNEAQKTTRNIITANATTGSGGINTSRLSRDTGGSNLASRSVTQVESKLKAKKTSVKRSGGSRKASRSIEELQLVFDKNKGAIYSIYNRALRKDPSLQGKVVLKLTIAPSGRVTKCTVVSSELNNPQLERKLLARVKLFQFGNRNVDTMVTTYPIEFLPS
jgi:TonB family protein